jgi:hypothetical protein
MSIAAVRFTRPRNVAIGPLPVVADQGQEAGRRGEVMGETATEQQSSDSKVFRTFVSTFLDALGRALGYGLVAIVCAVLFNWFFPSKDQIARFAWANDDVCKLDEPKNCYATAECASDEVAIGGQCIVSDAKSQRIRLFNVGISAPNTPNLSPTQHICVWEIEPKPGQDKLPLKVKVGAVCVKQSRFGTQVVLPK